jgi:lipopolysaccharide transport system ATP-binding protein
LGEGRGEGKRLTPTGPQAALIFSKAVTSHPAIRVSGLSKLYKVGARQQGYKTLRESIAEACAAPFARLSAGKVQGSKSKVQSSDSSAAPHPSPLVPNTSPRLSGEQFWALKDVSFEVQPGEVVGIIGRNGAGKSTLLKILSRITEPTSGRIELRGRVGSLLEVGTGFHPELTGRENIYMNGSILGMSRREIQRKFDEIVDFSGVEDFLDTPVKRYSSGMYVRLAFAVAAHLEPEILIVDEVLAVGDAAFQAKCLRKMQEVASHGRTVLLVSHNMAAVENLCSSAVCLADGRVQVIGTARQAISAYMEAASRQGGDASLCRRTTSNVIRDVAIWDTTNNVPGVACSGSDIRIDVDYQANQSLRDCRIGLRVDSLSGTRLVHLQSEIATGELFALPASGRVSCAIRRLPLLPGMYNLVVAIFSQGHTVDMIDPGIDFQVEHGDFFGSGRLPNSSLATFLLPSEWEVTRREEEVLA